MKLSSIVPHTRPSISPVEIAAVTKILRSGQLAAGPAVRRLERAMEKKTGKKFAFAVSSGTSALQLSLLALGISKGDAVIIPDFVCDALLNSIHSVGALPILADIEPDSGNLSLSSVKSKMTKKVGAIIAPHLFGIGQDLKPFKSLGVPIIEDCAQTFGMKIKGQTVGGMGDVSIFSFYATKLVCAGEGGLIATSSRRAASIISDRRDYDEKPIYRQRFNFKMTDIQAALAVEQLKRLPAFIRRRRAIAGRYDRDIQNPKFQNFGRRADNLYFRYIIKGRRSSKSVLKRLQKIRNNGKMPLISIAKHRTRKKIAQ